jgi:hypothetical protein
MAIFVSQRGYYVSPFFVSIFTGTRFISMNPRNQVMRPFSGIPLLLSLLLLGGLFSCSNKTEDFNSEQISEYMLLQPGKYITYRLDSLVFVNFERDVEIHRYQVKHVVDAQVTDNLGRPSYRIFRYLRDSLGEQDWVPNGSYYVTPLQNEIEEIDDNLRFVKLHMPMREGYSWAGNTHLPDNPYSSLYDFSNDRDIEDWEYYYDTFESMFSYQGHNYENVWTVEQQDDYFNIPLADPTNYGFKSRAVDKYAKGIGPVYREYELYEYQPNPTGVSPFYAGFGIRMWMIDHN